MMARFSHCRRGFSLIETLVAVAILAIISAPIFGAFMVARVAQAESTRRTTAQAMARSVMELETAWVRDPAHAWSSSQDVSWTTLQGRYPHLSTEFPGMNATITITDRPILTRADAYKEVVVEVSWFGAKNRMLTHQLRTILERRSV